MVSLPYTFFLILLSIIVALRFFSSSRSRKDLNLPPSPPGIPFIGHLHLLKHPVHKNLFKLSQKLGPVFSLRFGSRLAVVVCSPSLAEECFTKTDLIMANRPTLLHSKYLAYDNTIASTAPYGDHWKNLRKIMAMEVFSTARLNAFTTLRQEEMEIVLQNLSSRVFAKVQLKALFGGLNLNVVTRMMAGKRYYGKGFEDSKESREFRGIASEIFAYSGAWNPIEYVPFLQWINYKNYETNLKKIHKKLDDLLQGLVDERRRLGKGITMVDQLLTLQKSDPEYYNDTLIKGLILVMITAGTDTTAVTMEWTMASLLNNPQILKKAQAEIDTHVGQDRLLEEKDVVNLKYLQAIISEGLRMFPAGPLLVPHMPSEKCKVAGYDIPANTIILANAWAIGRDADTWDDPLEFKPERFLEDDGEEKKSKLISFGWGRRACPGEGLAHRVMGVGLGSLLQCFEWKRTTEELIDFTEGEGITMAKLVPLEGMCRNRDIMNKLFADYAKN